MDAASKVTMDGDIWTGDESKMDLMNIYDRGGNLLRMQRFNGELCNRFYDPEILASIKTFKLRDDDIYFPGYPRTGTNWTYERMSMLLRGRAETIRRNKTKDMIEVTSSDDFDKEPSPRVLCAHICLSDAPEQLAEKNCKIVYTLRDPKDAAVSMYNMYKELPYVDYKGEFEDFLVLYINGKIDFKGLFGHFRDAEEYFEDHPDIPVYIQVYEEAVKDPVKATQELSDFLQLPRDDPLCQAIAEKCELRKLKDDKDEYAFKVDGRSILFRKGVAGDWRNYFTEEMLEDYYRVYEEKMAGSRFYNLYSRDKDM